MPAENDPRYAPGWRDDLVGRPPVEIPPPVSSAETQVVMRQWEQLARANIVPAGAGQKDAVDRIPLKKNPDRSKEKSKDKNKRTVYRWTQGLWMRRAFMRTRTKAQQKAETANSSTARGFWKMADMAIGMALNAAPNQIIQIARKDKNTYRGYSERPR
jgi:hypothetical protein